MNFMNLVALTCLDERKFIRFRTRAYSTVTEI